MKQTHLLLTAFLTLAFATLTGCEFGPVVKYRLNNGMQIDMSANSLEQLLDWEQDPGPCDRIATAACYGTHGVFQANLFEEELCGVTFYSETNRDRVSLLKDSSRVLSEIKGEYGKPRFISESDTFSRFEWSNHDYRLVLTVLEEHFKIQMDNSRTKSIRLLQNSK